MANIGVLSKNELKILKVLHANLMGLRANTIKSLTALPQRTLYNNLKKLQSKKLIENIFPIWQLCQFQAQSSKLAKLLKSDKLQSHKFSFILRLLNKPDWWEKRDNKLFKLKEFQFKPIAWGNSKYEQLQKDNFLIQTFSNSIVFINQKKYLGHDAYNCYINSLLDTLDMLRFIEERFNYKFFNDGVPQFSVRTMHYVKVMDEIAKRCKKDKNMLKIIIDGKLRAWTDLSEPYGLEFGHKNNAVDDAHWYKSFVDDGLRHKPPKLSEIMVLIKEMAEQNKETAAGLNAISQLLKPELTRGVTKDDEKPLYIG